MRLGASYLLLLTMKLTSHVVTLWYRPLELLLGASNYGVAVDLWSTSCILGELYTSKPILPGKTKVEQLHKIFKLCGSPSNDYWKKLHLRHSTVMKPPQPYRRCVAETFKDIPAAAMQLMENLISVDPAARGTIALALKSEVYCVIHLKFSSPLFRFALSFRTKIKQLSTLFPSDLLLLLR